MSEAIGEMILPGTYIEVRAEGLIGVGGISTGNIGVVGTASRGPVDKVVILGSYSEAIETFGSYDPWPGTTTLPALTLTRTLEQVFKGGGSTVYAVRIASGTPSAASWPLQDASTPKVTVATLTANSAGTWAHAITVALAANTLTLTLGRTKEEYPVTAAGALVGAINANSRLVTAAVAGAAADGNAAKTPVFVGTRGDGTDGAAASKGDLDEGLTLLAKEPVNIVVAGGFVGNAQGIASMRAHLEATENDGRERIAVMGASSDIVQTVVTEAGAASNPRLVLVAPGILANDAATNNEIALPASFSAALVAGRLATLAPHISLTNKDVAAGGLSTDYTRAEQKQLLTNRVLVLQKNLGIRVLKGITTDNGAFTQISVRRIVDHAKFGVRIGSNPYIGRLNNARVRGALKATLDGFLSSMVVDEMLIAYTLDVTATRSEEITGIARVTMTLQPTFSIDFVRVTMTLS
jgi:hypothetical protein